MIGVHDQLPEFVPDDTMSSCTPSTTNKYSMFAVGAGLNVNVQVPSPLSTATGPPFGSQLHHGPVNLTDDAVVSHTVVVIVNAGGGTGQIGYGQLEVYVVVELSVPVSYTHLTLPTKRIV